MAQVYYLTHVVGTGALGDFRRAAMPTGVNYACALANPPVNWAICAVNTADTTAVDADQNNIALPANLDQAMTNQARNRINQWCTTNGVNYTAASGATYRQVANDLGNLLIGGGFSIDQLQVSA